MINVIKRIPRKFSLPLLILFIVLLYWSLNKGIVPFVMKVIDSELFLEGGGVEEEELGKVSNARTGFALGHCKAALKEEGKVGDGAQFKDAAYEAWSMGGGTYLVRSVVNVPGAGEGAGDRKFACKMRFNGGDAADVATWTMLGVDFNSPTSQ